MGVYVYQVVAGKKAYLDGIDEVEVGLLKYFTKPYWDVWSNMRDVGGFGASDYQKHYYGDTVKHYNLFFARQKKVKYRKYVVYEFVEGSNVYEMPEGHTWSYDEPHIGKGVVGKLWWNGEERAWEVCLFKGKV